MNRVILTLFLVLSLFLGACAQAPHIKQVSHYKTDIASRIDLNVTYDSRGEVAVYMSNPREQDVRLWLVQEYKTPEERVLRETQIYKGLTKVLHKIYRIPMRDSEINGTLYVRVLNTNGVVVLTSATIETSSIGETK